MVLPVKESAKAASYLPTTYVHAIEVPRIKVCAFRVVHPSDLVASLWRLRTCLYPLVKISSNYRHLVIKLGTLFGRAIEDVSVNTEDCLVDSRIDLIELDYVDEGLDVRPFALSWVTRFLVCERPKLPSSTWKL